MKTMRLFDAELNKVCVVENVLSDNEDVKKRLLQFGVVKNARVVVESRAWGNSTMIACVMGSRIAIDANISKSIVVKHE